MLWGTVEEPSLRGEPEGGGVSAGAAGVWAREAWPPAVSVRPEALLLQEERSSAGGGGGVSVRKRVARRAPGTVEGARGRRPGERRSARGGTR